MPNDSFVTRRGALAALAGGATSIWLGAVVDPRELLAAGAHAAAALRQTPPPTFQVLTPEQAADIEAFTSRIIPSDDGTPGAREAGVVYFIDHALATFAKERQGPLGQMLKTLTADVQKRYPGTKSFAALDVKRQDAMIAALEKAKSPVFEGLRQATIDGMFSSPDYGGNRNQVGWKLLGFANQSSWQAPFGWYDRDVQ
jgi:Gluconate 2-dehydrogenase subunit 3